MEGRVLKILAFDCSTELGSLAVVDQSNSRLSREFPCPRGRGGALFAVLQEAVLAVGPPDRIAVGLGPGSYNGLRITAAAADGLSLATGAGVVGICSLLALPVDSDRFLAIGDARGDQFYFAEINHRTLAEPIGLVTTDELPARLERFEGIPVVVPRPIQMIPHARVAAPDAGILASMAREVGPMDSTPEPIYLKPPHITQPGRMRIPG